METTSNNNNPNNPYNLKEGDFVELKEVFKSDYTPSKGKIESLATLENNEVVVRVHHMGKDEGRTTYGPILNWMKAKEPLIQKKEGGPIQSNPEGVTSSRISSWGNVPQAWKVVKKVPKVAYTNSPNDKGLNKILNPFISDDETRPTLTGINFDKDGITATDAYKLIHLPYPNPSFNGLYYSLKDKSKPGLLEGDKQPTIEGKFPAYKKILPESNEIVHKISVYKLRTFVMAILKGQFTNYTKTISLIYDKTDEGYHNMGFNAEYLSSVLESCLQLGLEYVYMSLSASNKPVIIADNPKVAKNASKSTGKDMVILIMPILLMDDYTPSVTDKMAGAAHDKDLDKYFSISYNLIDDEIYNEDGSKADFDINLTKAESNELSSNNEKILKKYSPPRPSLIILEYTKVYDRILTATDLETTYQVKDTNIPNGLYRLVSGALVSESTERLDEYPSVGFWSGKGKESEFKAIGSINRIDLLFFADKALSSVSKDDFRPTLQGFHFIKNESTDNKLYLEATDAHTAVVAEIENQYLDQDVDIIISNPDKLVYFLKNTADTNLNVHVSGNNVAFVGETTAITHRLIDGKYVNIQMVTPDQTDKLLELDITNLKTCLKDVKKAEKNFSLVIHPPKDGESLIELVNSENDKIVSQRELCKVSANYSQKPHTTSKTFFLAMPTAMHRKFEDGAISFLPKTIEQFIKTTESNSVNLYYTEGSRPFLLQEKDIEEGFEIINTPKTEERIKTKKKAAKKPAKKAEPRKYKLGDMWSDDFDYDGMLQTGMAVHAGWSDEDMRKLFDSFEDVNYHTAGKPLWEAIKARKAGDMDLEREKITEFKEGLIKEAPELFAQKDQPSETPAKFKQATIIWHEGTGEFDKKKYDSWTSLQKDLNKIYTDYKKARKSEPDKEKWGYDKVKLEILWDDETKMTERADVGIHEGDFNPSKEHIADYLNKSFGLDLKNLYKKNVSWEKEAENKKEKIKKEKPIKTDTKTVTSVKKDKKDDNTVNSLEFLLSITDKKEEKELIQKEINKLKAA